MRYPFFLYMLLSILVEGKDLRVYQYTGVKITFEQNGTNSERTIEREIDPACLDVPITNEMMWETSYVNPKVPDPCRAMFITSVGQIQPMKLHPEIETYGELEILKYLESMQSDPDKLLIDTRMENWYAYRTIPGAINIPHDYISHAKSFRVDFKKALQTLHVARRKDGTYDFSRANTIALFCNGSWCTQSPDMIKHLLKIGYPPKKIKWYRGGMHDWLMLNMTSTRKRETIK